MTIRWLKRGRSTLNEKEIINVGKQAIQRQATQGNDEYSLFLRTMLQNRLDETHDAWKEFYLAQLNPVLETDGRDEQVRLLREITLTQTTALCRCDLLINEFGDCEFNDEEIDVMVKAIDKEGRSPRELRLFNIQSYLMLYMSLIATRGVDAQILHCLDFQTIEGYTSKCYDVFNIYYRTMLRSLQGGPMIGVEGELLDSLLEGLEKIKAQIVAGASYREIDWYLTPAKNTSG